MQAVTVQQRASTRQLALTEVADPDVAAYALSVKVGAISLNRGEVFTALTSDPDGARPGWDFAGVVEAAPAESSFSVGERVFGLCPGGAWAERIAVPPMLVCRIPEGVSLEQAACLPVAGMTASIALEKRGALGGRSVLVTGATGGVGLMAVQLAAAAGARVTALVRSGAHRDLLLGLGAQAVVTRGEISGEEPAFDLIVDTVGGAVLGDALGWLASRGVCVLCGNAGGALTTFDGDRLRHRPGGVYGGTSLYGLFLGEELTQSPPADRLARLAALVAAGRLDPMIRFQADWSEVQSAATGLLDRRFIGKAVLTIA